MTRVKGVKYQPKWMTTELRSTVMEFGGSPMRLYVAWSQSTGRLKYIYCFSHEPAPHNPQHWPDVTPKKLTSDREALKTDAHLILSWMLTNQGERYDQR